MPYDLHDLPLSCEANAEGPFNACVTSYLKYRADTPEHLGRTLQADPQFGLAHCLRGLLTLTSYNSANRTGAAQAAQQARRFTNNASARERRHVDALEAWVAGDLDGALAIWESILVEYPRDILAFRLMHFNNFWLGRAADMLSSIERIQDHWSPSLPAYGSLLSCHGFALEECGKYELAERQGRRAIEIDPADPWGAHALAHTMEMQGRQKEGIALLDSLSPHWAPAGNLAHHLWWHRALFELELGNFDAVLELYDSRFRDLDAPLTKALPDLYIDVQNAASMLLRLELRNIAVGARWEELADKAVLRIGDCDSLLTLPHWMMALAASGRDQAAADMLDAMQANSLTGTTAAAALGSVALPVCKAVLAHRGRRYDEVIDTMLPILDRLALLGGSHAQRDVFQQLLYDACVKTGRADAGAIVLTSASHLWVKPAANRTGYLHA